jgi:pimeloyl-ACP methyl ester carboxylesterase
MGNAAVERVLCYFALPGRATPETRVDAASNLVFQTRKEPVATTWLHPSLGTRVPYSPHAIPMPPSAPVVVYSHGNGENLQLVYAWCETLANELGLPLFAYDYTGYGTNTDRASATRVHANLSSVLRHLQRSGHTNVVLYGRSIGTGPSISAAVRYPDLVRAVVLQSAFRSVVHCSRWLSMLAPVADIFPNETLLRAAVRQPVFLVHGTKDAVVAFDQALHLVEAPCVAGHLWLDGAGHNDIETTPSYRRKLVLGVRGFLRAQGELSGSVERVHRVGARRRGATVMSM